MTIDKVREVLHAKPFEPFTLRIADGRTVSVPHPDFVSVDPKGRVVHVFREDGMSEFIDIMLVTSIELGNGRARRKRPGRPRRS